MTHNTATAIIVAEAHPGWTCCVVSPASVRGVWLDELRKWAGVTRATTMDGTQKLRLRSYWCDPSRYWSETNFDGEMTRWLLVNAETVGAWGSLLLQKDKPLLIHDSDGVEVKSLLRQPDLVIVDESHRFTYGTVRHSGLVGVSSRAKRVVCLTATPDSGGLDRYWGQLSVLQPRTWGNYHDFARRYCGGGEDAFGHFTVGEPTFQGEFRARLQSVEHEVPDWVVARDLPEETRQRVMVRVSSADAKKLGPLIDAMRKRLSGLGKRESGGFEPGEAFTLRREVAALKHKTCLELAENLAAGEDRVVVWAWHHDTVERYRPAGEARGSLRGRLFLVHGGMSKGQVDLELVRWSVTKGGVLVATMGKFGTGVDRLAPACHQQVLQELPWTAHMMAQVRGRLVRMSQKHPVRTYVPTLEVEYERSLCERIMTGAAWSDPALKSLIDGLFGVRLDPTVAEFLEGFEDAE